ncbi:MAG: amidoligase family protein [bacterium]
MNKNKIKNLLFGVEFEFSEAQLTEIKNLVDIRINMFKHNRHWNVISDCTCTVNDFAKDIYLGGEVVSPILNFDNLEDFKEIKTVLELLKEKQAYVNNSTGLHIHFNAPQVIDSYNYIDFYELWIAFETVIYKFGFNQFQKGRKILEEHAKPLGLYQEDYLDFISYCRNNQVPIEDLSLHYTLNEIIFKKNYGLNFVNILIEQPHPKDTIEIRCPDSTLEYEEVKTITSFFKDLFEILINDYDKDYVNHLSHKILEYKSFETFFSIYKNEDLPLFEELLNFMNLDSKQEEKYIRQYLK